MTFHVRFHAALPHELDGVEPTEHDLPLYVKRVDELMLENKLLLGHLRVAEQKLAEALGVDRPPDFDTVDLMRGGKVIYSQDSWPADPDRPHYPKGDRR